MGELNCELSLSNSMNTMLVSRRYVDMLVDHKYFIRTHNELLQ